PNLFLGRRPAADFGAGPILRWWCEWCFDIFRSARERGAYLSFELHDRKLFASVRLGRCYNRQNSPDWGRDHADRLSTQRAADSRGRGRTYDAARFPACARAHRGEGRLRGRRVRRVYGGDGPAARRARRVRPGEYLPDVDADGGGAGNLHGGSARHGRRVASGTTGDGRMWRIAVRLLHAGIRD